MSAKDKRKKAISDHFYSADHTITSPTDSSSGELPVILPPAPDTPLTSPMPKKNRDKTKLGEKFAKQQKSLVNLEER
ncbi:hypothetical protein ABG768_000567, partial [Culter alburnus]